MSDLAELLEGAEQRRSELVEALSSEGTDCYRLLHTTEGRPGLAVDRYGPVLLAQTWQAPLDEGERATLGRRAERDGWTFVWNHRGDDAPFSEHHDPPLPSRPLCREAGLRLRADPRHRGRDPLLFLDFRAGRRAVREARARTVLNLFAYTCGVGLAACAGGAREVWNVDFAASALAVGRSNAVLNGFGPERFVNVRQDALAVLRQLAGLGIKGRARRRAFQRFTPRRFDLVVLDPPTFAKSPFGAVDIERDYPTLLKPAALATEEGGQLLLTNHSPRVSAAAFADVVRRCLAKIDVSIEEWEAISPDPDFPSPDDQPPLKMLRLRVRRGGAR